MESQSQWTDVKNIKFHHRVKRFYYKNLFRKIYTVAIIWLIAANVFSLFQYQSFAETDLNTCNTSNNYALNESGACVIKIDTKNRREWIEFETISIARPEWISEWPAWFTIMDRNLWATSNVVSIDANVVANTGSYGYKYQWWNNYGFEDGCYTNWCSDTITNSSVDVSTNWATFSGIYNNRWYYWNVFIKSLTDGSYNYNYWKPSGIYNNLWWWGWDANYKTSKWPLWMYWDDWGDRANRQWPCPTWWHVPSAWEWSTLINYWHEKNHPWDVVWVNTNLYSFTDESKRNEFMEYFKIPFAGRRNYDTATLDYMWIDSYFRSSSAYSTTQSQWGSSYSPTTYITYGNDWSYYMWSAYVWEWDKHRTFGLSLRCFKDIYDVYTVKFNDNINWWQIISTQDIEWWSTAKMLDISNEVWTLKWWYLEESETSFDFNTPITSDITLYARYSECKAKSWYVEGENWSCVCDTAHWYTNNGGECIVITNTLTFDPNWWTTLVWPVVVISGTTISLSDYKSEKTDYEFIWWNSDSWAIDVLPDGYLVKQDSTLYAIYRRTSRAWSTESWDFEILYIKSPTRTLFTIMDRNLWAIGTWAWSSANLPSYWSYYQWWNNYWFANTWVITTSSTQTNANGNGPSNYYNSSVFITRTTSPYGWDSTNNYNLWWWEGDTIDSRWQWTDIARRGPCPAWYHVPSTLEWEKARDMWCQYKMNGDWCTSDQFLSDLLLPYAWSRNSGSGDVANQWELWYYWSSSRYSENNAYYLNLAYYLNIGSSTINPQQDERTPAWFSVRCFMNTSNKDIIYNTNGWNSINNWTAVSRWRDGETLPIPTHSDKNKKFMWWYTTPGFELWSRVTTTALSTDADNKNITLYAKWECNTENWSYEVEWLCVNSYTITWKNEDGSVIDTTNVEYWVVPTHADVNKAANAEWTYTFGWWTPEVVAVEWDAEYQATFNWTKNSYTVTFKDWDRILNLDPSYVTYWSKITLPVWPTKESYIFNGWYKESTFNTQWSDSVDIITGDTIIYAKYDCDTANGYYANWTSCVKNRISWGGGSWDGKTKSLTKDKAEETLQDKIQEMVDDKNQDKEDQMHWSAEEQTETLENVTETLENVTEILENVTDSQSIEVLNNNTASQTTNSSSNGNYTTEFREAYTFAKSNQITTQPTIQEAKMYTDMTRIEMAKVMSNYATNVLWQTPDVSRWEIKYKDVSDQLNKEYDNAVTSVYQLWIMWINMDNNEFRPKDKVTRAEFATALSRMLYNTEDGKWDTKYYVPHIDTLYNKWIITNINPKLTEKRWYVMTMLMRSANIK